MNEDVGFMLGFVIGAGGILIIILSNRIAMRRNLKEYLFTLDIDSRKMIDGKLKQLYDSVESLAQLTNTRLLKTMHNDLI